MIKLRRIVRIAFALSLIEAGIAGADGGAAGTTAAGFLAVAPGVAPSGMADASLSLTGDLAHASVNPASLVTVTQLGIALSHSELADGSRHDWFAVGGPLGSATHWSVSALYAGQGTFEGRDASNQPTGTFDAASYAMGVSLARTMGMVTVGATGKFIGERLADVTGSGFTMDAGVHGQAGPIALGAGIQNAFGAMRYSGSSFDLPRNMGLGASYTHSSGLTVALDANFPTAYYDDVRAGLEYCWHGKVALRAGYRREIGSDSTEPLNGPTFGLGAGVHGMWLDYAYLPSSTGETQQRFGLSFVPSQMMGSMFGTHDSATTP